MTDVSQGSPRLPDAKELTYREALIIVGAVSCLMVGLVILRFGCNIAIDVCILGDIALARRSIRDCWNCWCPFFRTSTRYEEDQAVHAGGGDDTDLDTLMLRLSSQEKSLLMDSILTSKVVTTEDLSAWDDNKDEIDCEVADDSDREATQDTVSDSSEVCSICLHDFELGQETASTNTCQHFFHRECIRQWLASNNNAACPYCRADIITVADVRRTLHLPVVPHGS